MFMLFESNKLCRFSLFSLFSRLLKKSFNFPNSLKIGQIVKFKHFPFEPSEWQNSGKIGNPFQIIMMIIGQILLDRKILLYFFQLVQTNDS